MLNEAYKTLSLNHKCNPPKYVSNPDGKEGGGYISLKIPHSEVLTAMSKKIIVFW
jgi:hypothetical protein